MPDQEIQPPSEVLAGRLWQGGSPVDYQWVREQGISVVVDVSDPDQHPDPDDLQGISYLKHPVVDGDQLPEGVVVQGVARIVADAVRNGSRVLVHCGYGKNRSGLVTTLAVREIEDVPGEEALELVRSVRHRAVNNETFAEHLASLPAPSKEQEG